jgi:hypothetical protein
MFTINSDVVSECLMLVTFSMQWHGAWTTDNRSWKGGEVRGEEERVGDDDEGRERVGERGWEREGRRIGEEWGWFWWCANFNC